MNTSTPCRCCGAPTVIFSAAARGPVGTESGPRDPLLSCLGIVALQGIVWLGCALVAALIGWALAIVALALVSALVSVFAWRSTKNRDPPIRACTECFTQVEAEELAQGEGERRR